MAWIGKVQNVPAHSNFAVDGRVEHTWRKFPSTEGEVTIGEDDLGNLATSLPCNKGQYSVLFRVAINFMESGDTYFRSGFEVSNYALPWSTAP
jgi:hypothetical protein